MYNSPPSLTYGFHGTDKQTAMDLLINKIEFKASNEDYDWLGKGVYFWENNLERAKQYAEEAKKRSASNIKEPFVIGATIDLGNCLDLLNQQHLDKVAHAYTLLKELCKEEGIELPQNKNFGKNDTELKNRQLDCAVIRFIHTIAKETSDEFDSVRAVFQEGEDLYENAGFKKNNHIQIAILNPNCIKGIFLPREKKNSA